MHTHAHAHMHTYTHTHTHTHTYTHTHTPTPTPTPTPTHIHTHTKTHYIPKSHSFSATSSKDLFTVTAFRRAAVTEGGLSPTVSFCSAAHFERPASTADGRVMTCKGDGVTCMSYDTKYHKHISVKQALVHVYVCISPTNTLQRHCMQ